MFELNDDCHLQCLFLASDATWMGPLRRGLSERRISLLPVNSRAELDSRLTEEPSSAVALELGVDALEPSLILVSELSQEHSQALLIGLPTGPLGLSELAFREAGCTHIAANIREVEQVYGLIERYLKRVSRRPANVENQIMGQLPWSNRT